MTEQGLTKNEILATLTRSSHGNLQEYVPVTSQATKDDPEFMAHLISWNRIKGKIRDSKTALPVITLAHQDFSAELRENSLAHVGLLDPRNLCRAVKFGREAGAPRREMVRLVERYLRNRESRGRRWERTALAHRRSMKELYAYNRIKPSAYAQAVLFDRNYQPGSVFDVVAQLSGMSAGAAAEAVVDHHIPFLVVIGAMGEKARDTGFLLALIESMSPVELVTNTRLLERLGVKTQPELRGAFEQALEKAATTGTLKTTRAAESLGDEKLTKKLRTLQEKQIDATSTVEGSWAVLADKSYSMQSAIESSVQVAATLARYAKGNVHLVFFDHSPRYIDATGKSYEELKAETEHIKASGNTSIGCGLQYLMENNLEADGIAIVSDGGENQLPYFADRYVKYTGHFGKEVPVYLYLLEGDSNRLQGSCQRQGVDLQIFDLRSGVDYHSLPNVVQTMRTNRYSLADEVMAAALVKLDDVLPVKEVAYA